MISITIASITCPKCGADMSVHVGDNHHYLTCVACQYVATLERDATQRVDVIDLNGVVLVRAEDH